MRRHLVLAVIAPAVALACATAAGASWIFRPSYYSHEPAGGQRIAQYAAKETPYARADATYLQSAYRHSRSTIRAGGSADRLHIVETWGAGEAIRPYGEWQRPFRDGATPYGPWGNPQGPWTTPFGSWVNPYGLGQLPYPPYSPYGQWGYGQPGPQYPPQASPQASPHGSPHGSPQASPYGSPHGSPHVPGGAPGP